MNRETVDNSNLKEYLGGKYTHEGAHVFLESAKRGSSSDEHHDLMFKWFDWIYCGPEQDSCTNSCSPQSAMEQALMACMKLDVDQTDFAEFDPLGSRINPSPIDDPQAGEWNKCFDSGGVERVPMECAAINCGENVPTFINGLCTCTTVARPVDPRVNQCAFIDCGPDTQPVAGPNGCYCAGKGEDGLRPPRGGGRPPRGF
ncbi:MAG: hypothetical protein HY698_20670 [Deltaproteobacteria bacterium]|nr:hypothetical protein [Deltaproteobacteria bacterium]